ncbi:lysylphosphatidylglycerol synthase transmembrane domain-containing protein [Roseiconus lacunae]|uniref:Lysylphosphatidylglycerol synthase transmembrane domain-containing protein n=1 Tax=Roseiconus lacunae TaxID=2605694 RepID=A0ABT7PCX6_9BACT|nr:lysylphosphatidylglycerol synthase transmembrane domain-containing protein [Roseiconus lacunae]MDM4014101.1 lysylphosphatidylglycerol synthase transmembrane domain-containing protein [Roseiconus lacunae]WRQ53401.1 lysylphosphatidylglycerol synthase transmembrane domain-containing protein [Stieleria sp. HD01]
MNSPRQILLTLAKVMIPLGIIAFLVSRVTPEQWESLSEHDKNYPLLASALFVAVGAISLSFIRWCLLVRCQGIDLTMLEAHRLGAICFLLNFVSAGSVGGDLFKAIFLAKRRPGRRVQAVASVVVDRGVGLYGLLLLASAAFVFQGNQLASGAESEDMQKIRFGCGVLVILGTVVLCLLVFGGAFVDRLVRRGARLPMIGPVVERVGPPLRMFHHHPLAFGMSILMSLGVHGLLTVSVYLIARSLYPSVPTFAEHFIIVPIGMLASALPITPAGLGLFEAAIEWLYQLIPSEPTLASGTLIALVFEIVKVIIAIIGTVFYWTAGDEVRESMEEAEHEAESH